MKYILVTILCIFVTFCGKNKSHITDGSYDELLMRKRIYMEEVARLKHDLYRHRCDKLTFRSLASAFGNRELIEEHEYDAPGKYHRDITPCYPEASRSEISLDGYLSLAHHIVTYKDSSLLQRVISHGEANNFVMGDGPIEYTNILVLAPFLYSLENKLNLISDDTKMGLADVNVLLKGYKGHIAAMLILLSGRINGYLNDFEIAMMEQLRDANPNNPLYQAIYHRFVDGDQSAAIRILLEDFSEEFPIGDAKYGWGSAPNSVIFIVVVGILENR